MSCSIKVVCRYVTVCQKGGMSTTQTAEIFIIQKYSSALFYWICYSYCIVLFYIFKPGDSEEINWDRITDFL